MAPSRSCRALLHACSSRKSTNETIHPVSSIGPYTSVCRHHFSPDTGGWSQRSWWSRRECPDSGLGHGREEHSLCRHQGPAQTLDVYLPKSPKADKPSPVVVNIHGGAFRMGDKNMGVNEVIGLVASGDFAAVSINYSLSGQAIWPAQIHDCKAAIRWVRANAGKYNFDPENIGVIGAFGWRTSGRHAWHQRRRRGAGRGCGAIQRDQQQGQVRGRPVRPQRLAGDGWFSRFARVSRVAAHRRRRAGPQRHSAGLRLQSPMSRVMTRRS